MFSSSFAGASLLGKWLWLLGDPKCCELSIDWTGHQWRVDDMKAGLHRLICLLIV